MVFRWFVKVKKTVSGDTDKLCTFFLLDIEMQPLRNHV
jgi:hypothetical protein